MIDFERHHDHPISPKRLQEKMLSFAKSLSEQPAGLDQVGYDIETWDRGLFRAVFEHVQAKRVHWSAIPDMPTTVFFTPTKELDLWLAQQDSNSQTASMTPKKKRGRPNSREVDRKFAEEYRSGLEHRLWEGQADYLRRKHKKKWDYDSNSAKSWFSTLLKRVDKLEKSESA